MARLLDRAIILDLHDDTTQMIIDEGYNLAERHTFGQVDIPRMRTGHVGGIFMSIFVDAGLYTPAEAVRRSLAEIDAVRRETARHPNDLVLAMTADEILAARQRGRIAILMGIEGRESKPSRAGGLAWLATPVSKRSGRAATVRKRTTKVVRNTAVALARSPVAMTPPQPPSHLSQAATRSVFAKGHSSSTHWA